MIRHSTESGSRFERSPFSLVKQACVAALLAVTTIAPVIHAAEPAKESSLRWWKGNLHTHSFWSDGDDFPEMIADWYKTQGYHFLALSDHNITLTGEKWAKLPTNSELSTATLEKYVKRFGSEWVVEKTEDTNRLVKLKTLAEFRGRLEEPDRFLMIPSEEISDRYKVLPIHLNASNIRDLIPPQGGDSVFDVLQNNVNAVLKQREETGQPMFPHINHPNFGWALTAEDIMQVRGDRFFEVYNGHPYVRNYGDDQHASTERMWDIILAFRLTDLNLGAMYGLAVDDAHHYHEQGIKKSNAGRGWVMVRASRLTPEAILAAMEAGDFYASSGVRIKDIRHEKDRLQIEIEPEAGVTYTTQFIGTRQNFDRKSEAVVIKDSPFPTTRKYSDDIGEVFAEVKGTSPGYKLRGDEIYVRAKIVSSKAKENPYAEGEKETAWVQPLIPAK